MLASITPLGERGRQRKWAVTAVAFTLGATLAGTALFSFAGWYGQAIGLPGDLASWGLALVGLAVLADIAGIRPPGPHRQVDEDWLNRFRGWVVGLGYGFQLGLGFVTIVPAWASWSLLLLAAFSGPAVGAALGALFGLGRSILLLSGVRVHDFAQLRHQLQRFARWQRPVTILTAVIQAGVVTLIWVAV